MAPQLARAVEYLTCPRCAGNGTLATRHDMFNTTGCLHRMHTQATRHDMFNTTGCLHRMHTQARCPACKGTGMRENRPT